MESMCDGRHWTGRDEARKEGRRKREMDREIWRNGSVYDVTGGNMEGKEGGGVRKEGKEAWKDEKRRRTRKI